MNRYYSALMLATSGLAFYYLGALEAMVVSAILNGSSVLRFDYLEPVEGFAVLPLLMALLAANAFVELWRLSQK